MSLMTEEEAKNVWCPHVRLPAQFSATNDKLGVVGIAAAAPNVADSPIAGRLLTRTGEHTCCITSKCSQWQKSGPAENGAPTGYCGLAGMPHEVLSDFIYIHASRLAEILRRDRASSETRQSTK